jgi:hypothetical protein
MCAFSRLAMPKNHAMHYVNQAATCRQNGWMSHNGLVLVEHNNARTSCVCIATPPNCYRDLRVSLMVRRSASRRCASSATDVKKLENVGGTRWSRTWVPGSRAGSSVAPVLVRLAAASPSPCAAPALGRHLAEYAYCTPVSATVVPMICARGCVPERCCIRVRALERYRAGLKYLTPAV